MHTIQSKKTLQWFHLVVFSPILLATKSNLIRVMDRTIAAVCPLMLFKGKRAKKPEKSRFTVFEFWTMGTLSTFLKGILAF